MLTAILPKLVVVETSIYTVGIALTKISILVFYYKTFPVPAFRYAVWVLGAVVIGYTIATFFANIFSCNPVARTWDRSITRGYCINRTALYFAHAGLVLFTDFSIVLMPVYSSFLPLSHVLITHAHWLML